MNDYRHHALQPPQPRITKARLITLALLVSFGAHAQGEQPYTQTIVLGKKAPESVTPPRTEQGCSKPKSLRYHRLLPQSPIAKCTAKKPSLTDKRNQATPREVGHPR